MRNCPLQPQLNGLINGPQFFLLSFLINTLAVGFDKSPSTPRGRNQQDIHHEVAKTPFLTLGFCSSVFKLSLLLLFLSQPTYQQN